MRSHEEDGEGKTSGPLKKRDRSKSLKYKENLTETAYLSMVLRSLGGVAERLNAPVLKTPPLSSETPEKPSNIAASLVSLLSGLLSAAQEHPELLDLARAWPRLPESVREGILVMARTDKR